MQVAVYTATGNPLHVFESREGFRRSAATAAAFSPSGQGVLVGSQGAITAYSRLPNNTWAVSQTLEV